MHTAGYFGTEILKKLRILKWFLKLYTHQDVIKIRNSFYAEFFELLVFDVEDLGNVIPKSELRHVMLAPTASEPWMSSHPIPLSGDMLQQSAGLQPYATSYAAWIKPPYPRSGKRRRL